MKRILKVQEQIGALSKKSENPFFKKDYLDLNDLLNALGPLLRAEGLLLMQPILKNEVNTTIIDADSGEILALSSIKLPEISDPQKIGSCITYFRRYTLKSLFAIAERDDDGNEGAKPDIIWLTDEQFDKAVKSNLKGISATLDKFNTNTHKMKIKQSKELNDILNELIFDEEIKK